MPITKDPNYKTIEKFIQYVFYYYNGKINIFNPARLTIEWAAKYKYFTDHAGYSRLPNSIIINPSVILKHSDDAPNFKYTIIETIIHELYHTDQIIAYNMLDVDENYRMAMESAVEMQTLIYLVNNKLELQENFGISADFSDSYFNRRIHELHQYRFPYRRRRLSDHIFMIVDSCISIDGEERMSIKNMIESAIFTGKQILFNVNDDILAVNPIPNMQYQAANINEINDFFYHKLFKYDHIKNVRTSIEELSDKIEVIIKTDGLSYDMVIY